MYSKDYITGSKPVRIPAVSKHGFVRSHGTGEFAEVRERKFEKTVKLQADKPNGHSRRMAALCNADAKRRAARDSMFGL